MAEGTILVRTYASRAALPVADATILFSQTDGDAQTLLAVRQTDRSGRAAPVTVPTPALADSLAPEPGQPYALVRIDAYHPGYQRVELKQVQVFPGIQTIQTIEMIPLEQYPSARSETELIDLPTQNL